MAVKGCHGVSTANSTVSHGKIRRRLFLGGPCKPTTSLRDSISRLPRRLPVKACLWALLGGRVRTNLHGHLRLWEWNWLRAATRAKALNLYSRAFTRVCPRTESPGLYSLGRVVEPDTAKMSSAGPIRNSEICRNSGPSTKCWACSSPEETAEASRPISAVPTGLGLGSKANPGLASWAKFSRPCGTEFRNGVLSRGYMCWL
jgi:hypothetical protein